jgi:AcrR family transcriptional regulator
LNLKEHILREADSLFCQYGIKSVTMDDIAKHLGMSKKTIYQHFIDKNNLVVDLMRDKMENQVCLMHRTNDEAVDAVNEVFISVTEMQAMLSKMNPMLFYDLQKYHPEAWLLFKNFRENILYKVIYDNLQRGIKEGFFRKEVNLVILSRMRIQQIDSVFNQSTYPINEFNLTQVMTELTEHYLYGICTLKGHKQINKYKQILEDE